MKTYHGGDKVESGFYLNVAKRNLLSVDKRQELPGTETDSYIAIPVLVMLVIGPFLGLLYVMFLPFISIAMVSGLLAKKTRTAIKRFSARLAGRTSNEIKPVLIHTVVVETESGVTPEKIIPPSGEQPTDQKVA